MTSCVPKIDVCLFDFASIATFGFVVIGVCVCVHIYEGECKESWNVSNFLWTACCVKPAGSI